MNTNYQILQKEIFDLPVKRIHGDYIGFLENKFDAYYETLEQFDGELGNSVRSHSEIILCQMKCIFSSLHSHYAGKPSYAYLQLEKCLEKIRGHLWIQTQAINDKREKFYRMRIANNTQLNIKDLFHIPFDLRNKVRRQRFSISGVPSLYLSTSVYTCWEEMNRPDIKFAHVSRFDLNHSNLKFLFIDQRTEVIRRMLLTPYEECGEASRRHIENFILTFPLLLACSVQVQDYDSDFIPEYIVPQNLLQWVIMQDDIDAIQYSSNRTKHKLKPIGFESEANVVIPPKKFKSDGYCEDLSKSILLTDPISYNLLEIANDPIIRYKTGLWSIFKYRKKHKLIELFEDDITIYADTIFGKLENKLSEMKTKRIHE